MKTTLKIFASLLLVFAISTSYAQNFSAEGNKFERPGKDYRQNSRTRDITIRPDNSYQANFRLRADRSYFISVVGNQSENVQLRISDANTKEILYDNAANEFRAHVTVFTDTEREITVEVNSVYNRKQKENISLLYAYK